MTPQELKNSILQLAIQGKLVDQRPEEGTAEELFREIQKEKQALIKAGKIKKEKPLPEISEDELPFEIPENWKWVRLDELVTKEIKRGKSPTYVPKSGTLVFAQKCNTKAGYIDLSLSLYLDETKLIKYPESEFMRDKDIVINSTGNGTLGRVGIYRDSDNPSQLSLVPDSHVTVIRTSSVICIEYVFYGLKYYQPYMEKLGSGSTNQTELSASIVRALLFPLPPLAEQKRIVAKIEELLPLIDRYEKAWTRLEDFNRRFPGDMQKSILQMAIQGKLVEQRPEEGTGEELYQQIQKEKQALIKAGKIKKEKPLSEISDDELPFDIPETWKWVRLGAVVELLSGFAFKSEDFKAEGKYRLLRGINLGVNEIRWKETVYVDTISDRVSEYKLVRGDVLLGLDRPWISDGTRVAIFNEIEETYLVQRVLRIRGREALSSDFVAYILHSSLLKNPLGGETTGISVPHISPNQVGNIVVPLPPLAEQKRIVARLEELLPLCERLK